MISNSSNTPLPSSNAHILDQLAGLEHDETVKNAVTGHNAIDRACEEACRAIAPSWPLDRAIAVNPHWGRINRPLRQVAARMALLGDIPVFPKRITIREAWKIGRITREDLLYACTTLQQNADYAEACISSLWREPNITRLPLLIDLLDDKSAHSICLSWRHAITHQISQTCATYFDEYQADWQPGHELGLYEFWRETLTHDHGIGVLMGLPDLGKRLANLPATRKEAESWSMRLLDLPEAVWTDYLEAVLLTVNGWASWCAYIGWQAGQVGHGDDHLRDLLAIRLAWEVVMLECKTKDAALQSLCRLREGWTRSSVLLGHAERELITDEVWQLAFEAGYQRQLAQKLRLASAAKNFMAQPSEIEVQAAFCIDVRSERLRRAVEAAWTGIQTIGYAGFFGLPIAYTPLATNSRRPQLPGLLAPQIEVIDSLTTKGKEERKFCEKEQFAAKKARLSRFALDNQLQTNSRWPGTAFSFVETAGFIYLGKLASWLTPTRQPRIRDDMAGLPKRLASQCRPTLTGLDVEGKANLTARVLRTMGLDCNFAPVVLLIGHGSQSINNAHAATLDCGACCGQTGEVNARVLALLLNDPHVRAGLVTQNIEIPPQTVFVAGLHNTATDEIEWFDLDLLPSDALQKIKRIQSVFEYAGDQVRRERAPDLSLDPRSGSASLLQLLRRRANDGAQTRPEWGLAGNASFIIGPRARTQDLVLDGRTFLHDYDSETDSDASVLELLMTAPMLVAHWINWQYHASVAAPEQLGSGNKILHNVVGGHIGVFEGNGGDLRIGLSKQSLHDGKKWMHEPLRLTVAIDAPIAAIDSVIRKHNVVRHLVEHGWLHLWHLDKNEISRYVDSGWQTLAL